MPVLPASSAPTHELGTTRFTTLASPASGTTETSVWRAELPPGTPGTPHTVSREEVLVVLSGRAAVQFDDADLQFAEASDAIVVPPGVRFSLANEGDEVLRLLACLPVGGQATLLDGATFIPPWAE